MSRYQRDMQKGVAQEWGLDYSYVPDQAMETVEASREQWESDLIWDYLHVPKPQWTPDSEVWVRFQDIYRQWKLGRTIYKDRVLVLKAGQHIRSYYISVKGEGDTSKRLPDPWYYLLTGSQKRWSQMFWKIPIDCKWAAGLGWVYPH